MHSTFSAKERWWLIAGFALLGFVAYGASLSNIFVVWDDNYTIVFNPIVRSLSPWGIWRAFTSFDPELYVPLTVISYQFNYALAGNYPPAFHLVSLLLHIGNAILVAFLAEKLLERKWIAVICGIVFLIHPLNVEAVAWASARKDVLSTLFFLLSILFYLRSCSNEKLETKNYTQHRALSLGLLFFLLGLLSKAMVLTLPVVLLLIDWVRRRPLNRQLFTEKLPYFALSIVFGIIALFGKQDVTETMTLAQKILMAGKSTVFALEKFFVPAKLSVLYPHPGTIDASPDFLIPMSIVAILLCIAIAHIRQTRWTFFGIAFFLVTIFPTFFNFTKGGEIYVFSDRYAYVPMIGLLLLIGRAAVSVVEFPGRKQTKRAAQQAVFAGAGVLGMFFLFATMTQAKTWKNTESLFLHTLKHYPDAIAANLNLGAVYVEQQRNDDAMRQMQAALTLRDHYVAHTNIGTLHERAGKRQLAYEEFRKAMVLEPKAAMPHYGIALLYARDGKIDDAVAAYRKAIELDPTYVGSYNNLGILELQRGDLVAARSVFEDAAAADPLFADAHYHIGLIDIEEKKPLDAIVRFERAVKLEPNKAVDALNKLAVLYLEQMRVDDAIDAVEQVLELDPTNEDALFLQASMRKHGVLN